MAWFSLDFGPRQSFALKVYKVNTSHLAVDIEPIDELHKKRITRIVTTEFPKYFALVSRVRLENMMIGPSGGIISSTVVPQAQAVFPEGALKKTIKVGLQVGNSWLLVTSYSREKLSPRVWISFLLERLFTGHEVSVFFVTYGLWM